MKARRTSGPDQLALLQGTLEVLILRILIFGPQHGQGIARAIKESSDDELLVDHGALYPALQRLEAKKWITAKWGPSSNNRRARFYTITKGGRAQLVRQSSRWRRLVAAMARVLGPDMGKRLTSAHAQPAPCGRYRPDKSHSSARFFVQRLRATSHRIQRGKPHDDSHIQKDCGALDDCRECWPWCCWAGDRWSPCGGPYFCSPEDT